MLRQKLTNKQLEYEAPFYKYDESGVPQSFLDAREFVRYLRAADKKQIQQILVKIGMIKHMIFKRYYEIKRELAFIKWVESKRKNWQMSYSRPRYRTKFTDPHKQKIYSDSVLRNDKINNQQLQEERYQRLKAKHTGGEKMPPAMAGLRSWRNYFTQCVNLNELTLLDKCIVEVLVSYEQTKKHVDVSRQTALDYLARRRKYSQSEIDEGVK